MSRVKPCQNKSAWLLKHTVTLFVVPIVINTNIIVFLFSEGFDKYFLRRVNQWLIVKEVG